MVVNQLDQDIIYQIVSFTNELYILRDVYQLARLRFYISDCTSGGQYIKQLVRDCMHQFVLSRMFTIGLGIRLSYPTIGMQLKRLR